MTQHWPIVFDCGLKNELSSAYWKDYAYWKALLNILYIITKSEKSNFLLYPMLCQSQLHSFVRGKNIYWLFISFVKILEPYVFKLFSMIQFWKFIDWLFFIVTSKLLIENISGFSKCQYPSYLNRADKVM